MKKYIYPILMAVLTSAVVSAKNSNTIQGVPKPLCDLSYTRIELAPEKNAYLVWTNAQPLLAPPTNATDKTMLLELGNFHKPLPPPDQLNHLRQLIANHSEALELYRLGTIRGKFQLPATENMIPPSVLDASKWLKPKIRLLVEDQKHAQAMDEAFMYARSGKIIAEGSDLLITYTMGVAIRNIGLNYLGRIACDKNAPKKVVEHILARYPSLRMDDASCIHAMKADYQTKFCPLMEKAATDTVNPEIWQNAKYFDLQETKALEAYLTSRVILNIKNNINASDSEVKAELELFKQLPAQGLDWTWLFNSPLSEKSRLGLRRAAAGCHNVIGRWLIYETPRAYFAPNRQQVSYAIHRCVIALRLYEIQHGRLPDSLSDLVTTGILKKIPQDPYARQPLKYDQKRKIVWSIYTNRVDDGGKWAGSNGDLVIHLTNDAKDYANSAR